MPPSLEVAKRCGWLPVPGSMLSACGSEERSRDVAPAHVGRRSVDPSDLARLGVDANHDEWLAAIRPLDDRLAARVEIMAPCPSEEHAVAGVVEVEGNVVASIGRRMNPRGRGVQRKICDHPSFGKDVHEKFRTLPCRVDPLGDLRSGRGYPDRCTQFLPLESGGRNHRHVFCVECREIPQRIIPHPIPEPNARRNDHDPESKGRGNSPLARQRHWEHPWEGARQEHARLPLVQAVALTELLKATRFLPAGEESIEEQHAHVRDEDEHAGPDEESSESENREPQVLGVASESVESAGDESPTPEFCPVNLSEAKDKKEDPKGDE